MHAQKCTAYGLACRPTSACRRVLARQTEISPVHSASTGSGGRIDLGQSHSLAKLCTYLAWFLRPSQLKTVPYFEIPMPISRLRLLMQFRMGPHALPVEQGRLARPAIPWHLRRCTLCETRALENERHFVFDCPHFAHICRQCRWLY